MAWMIQDDLHDWMVRGAWSGLFLWFMMICVVWIIHDQWSAGFESFMMVCMIWTL
jgi:hypothetical protein